MPSGIQVEADLLSAGNPNVRQFWSLDIYVRVFEGSKGRMDGLCGNFDDDSTNDIRNTQFGTVHSGDPGAQHYR